MGEYVDDEELLRMVELKEFHGTNVAAAKAAGMSRSGFIGRLHMAVERGLTGYDPVMPGYVAKQVSSKAPDGSWVKQVKAPGPKFELLPGEQLKRRSVYVDAEGRIHSAWMITKEAEFSIESLVATFTEAFKGFEGRATALPPPPAPNEELLTLIPCNDWHINMLSWERETGTNWDLKIAEKCIGEAISRAILRAPSAGRAIVLGGGDLLHADNKDARTAASGHALDVDGRYQKGMEVAQRLMVHTIDTALLHNDHVTVRVLQGNHDEHSSIAIAYFLLAWYRNEPRVLVDVDASLFFWYRFGKVLLGATHGHQVKIEKMAAIMAHRRAVDWGNTLYRYVHGFHLHHKEKFVTEGEGVVSEVHQAPIPQDAWHYGSGFLSGRSVTSITYHRDFGEFSRSRELVMDA